MRNLETTILEQLGYACRCANSNRHSSPLEVLDLIVEFEVLGEEFGHFTTWAVDVPHCAHNVGAPDPAQREDQSAGCSRCWLLRRILEDWSQKKRDERLTVVKTRYERSVHVPTSIGECVQWWENTLS